MKIIAVTNCEEWVKERFGYYKLVNSWKYFHPDIPIYNWGDEETERIKKENSGFDYTSFMPIVMLEAKKKYNADLIIKLDSDSVVLDRLSEVIDCNDETEVFGVRNDGDHIGDSDERQNRPRELWNLPNEKYVNCGCLATTSEEFLKEWLELNKIIIKKYGGIKEFWMCEQNTMNVVFYSGKYKTKILDEKGNNLFYGAAANFNSNNNYVALSIIKEYGGNFKNWSSWKDVEYKNDKFWLQGKQIKILHAAGGGKWENSSKLDWDRFNPEIIPVLKKITNEHN